MAAITLTVTSQSSKADEITFLNHVASKVGENTYLKNLFSPAMLQWAASQITNDFPVDLYDFWQAEVRGHRKDMAEMNATIRDLQAEITELKRSDSYNRDLAAKAAEGEAAAWTKLDTEQKAHDEAVGRLLGEGDELRRALGAIGEMAKAAWFDGKPLDLDVLRMILKDAPK